MTSPQDYLDHGFALCAIKPKSKRPHGDDWQNRPLTSPPAANYGVGLIHQHTGTCSIDIDDWDHAEIAMDALGINLSDLFDAPDAVQIIGKPGRGKLLYRLPPDIEPKRHNLNWPNKTGKGHHCVIEFRAGLVQDVLPPSVHPTTKEPYQWGGSGDWRDPPELPEPLAQVWREWELAREAMRDACPWHEPAIRPEARKAPAPKRTNTGVIDAYNDAHDPGAILEAHGYRPAGKRWLSPHSDTKIPGVIRLPDADPPAVYCHHASDPLSDGHKHDAFSLYCQLDHDGDVTKAVREAADLLDITPQQDRKGAEIADGILKKRSNVHPIPSPPTKSPEETTAPHPGQIPIPVLRDMRETIESRVHAFKDDAITQATLSLACAVTARRYQTPDRQPTTTFFGMTDSSTAGLRPIKGALYSLAGEIGERAMLRGTKIPSSGVLYQALIGHPRMYWCTDEYGHIVQMARRQQSGALESAIAVLHEAYTGQTLYIDGDTATTGRPRSLDERDIYTPTVTLMALLAQDHLSALGQRSEYGRGTLQQMLCVPAGDETRHHEAERTPAPNRLVEQAKALRDMPGIAHAQEIATNEAQMTPVHWGKGAHDRLSDGRARMLAYMGDEERQVYRGMAHGYHQSARRLACALAAWEAPECPVVSEAVAQWAAVWAERCLMLTVPRLIVTASDTDEPDVMQRVMQVLFERRRAMTARDIARSCRAFRGLASEEREKLLCTMVDDGALIAERKSGPGRPAVKYQAARTS